CWCCSVGSPRTSGDRTLPTALWWSVCALRPNPGAWPIFRCRRRWKHGMNCADPYAPGAALTLQPEGHCAKSHCPKDPLTARLGDNPAMAIVTEPSRAAAAGPSATGEAALPESLALEFCGLRFASPIVLLSGCVGFGEEYTRVEGFSNRDVGAIVLKGTTGSPRLGNAPHRVYETPEGILNAIGLQNPGVAQVVERILPTLDFEETRFFAIEDAATTEEYVE